MYEYAYMYMKVTYSKLHMSAVQQSDYEHMLKEKKKFLNYAH